MSPPIRSEADRQALKKVRRAGGREALRWRWLLPSLRMALALSGRAQALAGGQLRLEWATGHVSLLLRLLLLPFHGVHSPECRRWREVNLHLLALPAAPHKLAHRFAAHAGAGRGSAAPGGHRPRLLQQHAKGGGAARLQAHPQRRARAGGAPACGVARNGGAGCVVVRARGWSAWRGGAEEGGAAARGVAGHGGARCVVVRAGGWSAWRGGAEERWRDGASWGCAPEGGADEK